MITFLWSSVFVCFNVYTFIQFCIFFCNFWIFKISKLQQTDLGIIALSQSLKWGGGQNPLFNLFFNERTRVYRLVLSPPDVRLRRKRDSSTKEDDCAPPPTLIRVNNKSILMLKEQLWSFCNLFLNAVYCQLYSFDCLMCSQAFILAHKTFKMISIK